MFKGNRITLHEENTTRARKQKKPYLKRKASRDAQITLSFFPSPKTEDILHSNTQRSSVRPYCKFGLFSRRNNVTQQCFETWVFHRRARPSRGIWVLHAWTIIFSASKENFESCIIHEPIQAMRKLLSTRSEKNRRKSPSCEYQNINKVEGG